MSGESAPVVGIVAIGRNEGSRLERCLRAAIATGLPVVYVDSASTDDSVRLARELGADVVELDPTRPLSAARGRNAGFRRLVEMLPTLDYVQFIDGDCEILDGWIAHALERLEGDARLGAVCGRRLERFRSATVYNRLIDLEWDTPVGPTTQFGGDVMLRVAAFRETNGYDESLIAGEDPDLASRVRTAGWTLERLDREMTLHDAGLDRFGQWWTRQVRAGHAAFDAWLRAPWSDTKIQHRVASIVFWGGALPLFVVLACAAGGPGRLALWLLLGYPILGFRIYRRLRGNGRSALDAALYAGSCIEGKFAEFYGGAQCLLRHWRQTTPTLIEYK